MSKTKTPPDLEPSLPAASRTGAQAEAPGVAPEADAPLGVQSLNERIDVAYRLISAGAAAPAAAEARALLAEKGNVALVRLNCAGLLIDAGERLDDGAMVQDGVAILEALRAGKDLSESYQSGLTYNLANGKAALLSMARRESEKANEDVRDLAEEEAVVALYYDSADSLRSASAERVINCASMLRVEGRVHEAIDLIDGVLRRSSGHPNAHLKMAEFLWVAISQASRRDAMPEALLVPALIHYARAASAFDAVHEPMFAQSARSEGARLTAVAEAILGGTVDAAIAEVGERQLLSPTRLGEPLGMSLLARSPYRDEDDPWLVDGMPAALRELAVDAAGTFCAARAFLKDASVAAVAMPRWGSATPDTVLHLRYASVRQCWSVLEKVAWLVNAAFQVGIPDERCHFATLFRPPPKEVRAAFGLSGSVRFHPKLTRKNPGLRALAGLSCAFDAERGVYAPLKRLRHATEHRVPSVAPTAHDAAFFVGIARAALLHAVDAVMFDAPS